MKQTTQESQLSSNNLAEWNFPDVDSIIISDDMVEFISGDKKKEEKISPEELERQRFLAEIEEIKLNLSRLTEETAVKKQEYESNIDTIKHLIDKFNNPAALIESDIVEVMEFIIKKMVKKITLRDIELDPNILLQVVGEIKNTANTDDAPIKIYFSKHDFDLLLEFKIPDQYKIYEDPELHHGDIIIKSDFTEVRAKLDDRIEQLLRIEHA